MACNGTETKPLVTALTKSLLVFIVVLMTGLCVLTFIPYSPARAEAGAFFTTQEIDTGLQYTLERRFFFWASTAVEFALLLAFALTSLSRRCADRFLAWTGNRRIVAALAMGLLYASLHEILYLPIGALSPTKVKRLRVVHVLDSYERRADAKEYLW